MYIIKIYDNGTVAAGEIIREHIIKFLNDSIKVYVVKLLYNTHFFNISIGERVQIAEDNGNGNRTLFFQDYGKFIKQLKLEII